MSGELTAVKHFLISRNTNSNPALFLRVLPFCPNSDEDRCLPSTHTHTQTPHPRDTKHPYTQQLESRQGFALLPLLSNIWDMYAWWAMSHSSVLFFCSLQFCCLIFFLWQRRRASCQTMNRQERKARWSTDITEISLSLLSELRMLTASFQSELSKNPIKTLFYKEPVKCSVYITQTYNTPFPDSFIQSWPLVVTAFLCGSLAIFNHCNLFYSLPSSTGHHDEVQPF